MCERETGRAGDVSVTAGESGYSCRGVWETCAVQQRVRSDTDQSDACFRHDVILIMKHPPIYIYMFSILFLLLYRNHSEPWRQNRGMYRTVVFVCRYTLLGTKQHRCVPKLCHNFCWLSAEEHLTALFFHRTAEDGGRWRLWHGPPAGGGLGSGALAAALIGVITQSAVCRI